MEEQSNNFESLGLVPWITKQIKSLGKNNQFKINLHVKVIILFVTGMKSPTPVQANCIPRILAGQDCIGAAKTGSGKTFAFALPILQKLSEEPRSHFALILTPTHELAYQISEQFLIAGQPMGCRVCVVAGGTDQLYESQRLQNRPHIIVAMPGRLADHLTGCNTFSFDNLKFLVIDEADRMLSGGFDENLSVIEKMLPKNRQNLYFSATFKNFNKETSVYSFADDTYEWAEENNVSTVETLDQRYVLCAEYDRDMVLIETLRKYRETKEKSNIIIFTNTKK